MSVDLKMPTEQVENIRLPMLLHILKTKFGDEWYLLEDETISLTLGMVLTPLLVDKINLLKVMVQAPELFYEDFVFFLHATDVFNNTVTDFQSFPVPTSLDIAWAVKDGKRVSEGQFSDEVKTGVTKLLLEEGYSEAPGPLLEVCFPDRLVEGQEVEDRAAKAAAVAKYIEHMEETK